MIIWVDADACPVVIKEILFRAAERTKILTILVANSVLRIPKSNYIEMLQVGAGFDVADNEIVAQMNTGDLVITSDIPLAAEVIEKGGLALSVRGELYTSDNIKSKLNMRDFMDNLRSTGIDTGGSAAFSQTDRKNFANYLDQILTKSAKTNQGG
ncbi:MAG: YaiI/YqxD family protein [Mariprofundaceae bacterium]